MPVPVHVACSHCGSGIGADARTQADADRLRGSLMAQAMTEGWLVRAGRLYCPRCVTELFRPRLPGLTDGPGGT